MPLGALLWAAPSHGQHITGARGTRVSVTVKKEEGEFALCFDKIDDSDILRKILGIENQPCCDGLIFYAHQQTRVICLVEMKHANIKQAAIQIDTVRKKLYDLWREEYTKYREIDDIKDLFKNAIWRAYVYQSSSTDRHDKEECLSALCKHFGQGDIDISGENDITDFLRYGAKPQKRQEMRKKKKWR